MSLKEEMQKIIRRVESQSGISFTSIGNPMVKRAGKYTVCYLTRVSAVSRSVSSVEATGDSIGVASKLESDRENPNTGAAVAFRRALEAFVDKHFKIKWVTVATPRMKNEK